MMQQKIDEFAVKCDEVGKIVGELIANFLMLDMKQRFIILSKMENTTAIGLFKSILNAPVMPSDFADVVLKNNT